MEENNASKASVFLTSFKRANFSRSQLAIFILAFAVIGFLIIKSFAAAPIVASIEAERMTATAPAAISSSFSTSISNGMAISSPYIWTFNPGVAANAGYFFADGHLLKKITGPGPYAFRINASTLSSGAHQLGHAWDTTGGQHKSPSSPYGVTVSATTKTGFVTTLSSGPNITLPYTWAFDAGVSTRAGYFFADGKLLQKITGPGPYALTLSPTMLAAGPHQLGHSWDTSGGQHQAPTSAYSVNINSPVSQPATNYSVVPDSSASGGQAMKFGGGVKLSGPVSLNSSSTSVTVVAHGELCGSTWPQMLVAIDGNTVINNTVSSSSWGSYSANVSLASGDHTLTITNVSSGNCQPNLYTDVSNFYGPVAVTPAPTVSLSASPSSVNAGSSSTLTWASTNATSCTASGAWSGAKLTSGSASTGSLNQNSAYTLTCTSPAGSASASTVIIVTATPVAGSGWTGPWRNASYTMPTSFTKVITTASAFKSLVSASGSLVAGDVVHVVGPMKLDGCAGCQTYILKKLAAPGASIYFDNNVVFAGDTNTNVGYAAVYVDATNISLYGGTVAGGQANAGIKIGPGFSADTVPTTNIKWWGVNVHDVGADGVDAGGEVNSAGTWLGVSNVDVDADISNVCQQPHYDPHAVKGTGMHAIYIGGSSLNPPTGISVTNSKFSIYAHDISTCVGDAQVGQSTVNSEFWIHADRLSYMPASGYYWGAARAFTPWTGATSSYNDNNITVHDVEAHNLTGPVVVTESLGSGPVTVEYGRGLNVLTNSNASSYFAGNAYQPNSHITYQNIAP